MPTASGATTFEELFAGARRASRTLPGGVREEWLALDSPLLRARSRQLISGALLFIHGENQAREDLLLRHDGAAPITAVHTSLRGPGTFSIEGLEAGFGDRVGELQVFAAPRSRSTVRLQADVENEAFRIVFAPSMITDLAARHPELEKLASHVATGTAFCGEPYTALPLRRLIDQIAELMNSSHYGALQPLFLESRALEWLALSLCEHPDPPGAHPHSRQIERMHAARELLLARVSRPPTLTEVAHAVGINEFSLKRDFKAVFGRPVHAYLLVARLAEACRLLRDTEDSVKQIAAAVGYAYPNHFSTAFRRAYGTSPASFRQSIRSGESHADARYPVRELPKASS